MNNEQFKRWLDEQQACHKAIVWLGKRTPAQALAECERGDWLLWWFFHMKDTLGWPDIKTITKVKVKCARLVQHLMTDKRSLAALDVAERWVDGLATDEELEAARVAATAAYAVDATAAYAADATAVYAVAVAAAYADDDDATAAVADAAAYAADAAASAAADAAVSASASASASAAAYVIAAYAATRQKVLQQCADICREYFTIPTD